MPILLQGDCLEVMRDLSDHSVDCFICDLPYGCLTGGDAKGKGVERQRASGKCTWDVKIDLAAFWEQVKRLSRNDHTPVLMFCNTKFGIDLINSNPSWFRYDLVWDKGRGVSFLLANKMPMKSHEMIYVFSKKGTFYRRVDEDAPGKPALSMERSASLLPSTTSQAFTPGSGLMKTTMPENKCCSISIFRTSTKTAKRTHPTEKPVALYKWLLERYCPEGGTVLDPTAGSFNAILAAQALSLHGIGIEKDEGFFKKALTKFQDLSGNIIELI
jgi:site-specific DNA-methyltransferase (adenine-specific)